jgi:hypothetical protein
MNHMVYWCQFGLILIQSLDQALSSMPSPLVLSNQVASSSTQPAGRSGSILSKIPPTAGVELVPDGKRPLKRSRTGCLTW